MIEFPIKKKKKEKAKDLRCVNYYFLSKYSDFGFDVGAPFYDLGFEFQFLLFRFIDTQVLSDLPSSKEISKKERNYEILMK